MTRTQRIPKVLRILISNDDGVYAPGINILAHELRRVADVTIVAPGTDQSASSHSLTLTRPLRIRRHEDGVYSVDGTPTDAVTLAFHEILRRRRPHLVVSGLNHGANMGEDVTYSGTVAAAIEGALMGVPAIAASVIPRDRDWRDFTTAAKFIRRLIPRIIGRLPKHTLLNINFPKMPRGGYRKTQITGLGRRIYTEIISTNRDPRGLAYYWIGGEPSWDHTEETDAAAVRRGYVSITPLKIDMTDTSLVDEMRSWRLA
jgi:5'-nucleotidase